MSLSLSNSLLPGKVFLLNRKMCFLVGLRPVVPLVYMCFPTEVTQVRETAQLVSWLLGSVLRLAWSALSTSGPSLQPPGFIFKIGP